MIRVCAWCNRLLSFYRPVVPQKITHGICVHCYQKVLATVTP